MIDTLNAAAHRLHSLLAAGPVNSRDVLAGMVGAGFSPKQTRTARERLDVVIERAGSGAAMHSTWRLPAIKAGGTQDQGTHRSTQPGPAEQLENLTKPNFDRAELQMAAAFVPKPRGVKVSAARSQELSPDTQRDVLACVERGIPVTVRKVVVGRAASGAPTPVCSHGSVAPRHGTPTSAGDAVPVDSASANPTGNTVNTGTADGEPPIAAPLKVGDWQAARSETSAPTLPGSAINTPARPDPLQRSRQIATMEHDELKAYAKQIGMRQRDIEELSIDRLRQNCMLTVAALVAALTDQ